MGGDKNHVAIVLVEEYAQKTSPSNVVRVQVNGSWKVGNGGGQVQVTDIMARA